ncbi:hypothetical protein [Actinophytocola sp.]|jgi:hypothetical protein|uniref:hypothetical protein n=1 Tax=Actinophytocola sp. TaxID=1872138 RepID=UPI002EDA8E49
MVNSRYLTNAVEDHVRDVLSAKYETVFTKEALRLQPGGYHEFDAVSDNRRIVASIKTASGGRHPTGNVLNCIAELYFLSLVRASKRILVLTSGEFQELFARTMDGKVAHGIEISYIPLPAEVASRVAAVQLATNEEIQPVLDAAELRAVGGH